VSVKYWVRLFLMGGGLFLIALSAEAAATDRTQLLLSAPWHGSYVCNQGLTRLRLTLRALPGGDGNRMEAEFSFSPDPDNPSVPTGLFRLTGSLQPATGVIVLKQDRWLEQPTDPSYRMVDMEGQLVIGEGQAMIRGRVTTYGCQDFAVWQYFTDSTVGR